MTQVLRVMIIVFFSLPLIGFLAGITYDRHGYPHEVDATALAGLTVALPLLALVGSLAIGVMSGRKSRQR